MSNEIQPIQEEDYPAFMQWVHRQPVESIIAKSCHAGLCAVARWYSEVTGQLVAVTILKHFLNEEALNTQDYHYNPYWVRGITEALDKYTCGRIEDVKQWQFVNEVLPIAYRWGVSELNLLGGNFTAKCRSCGGDYTLANLIAMDDGSGEYQCKTCHKETV